MFESVSELWKHYTTLFAAHIPPDDARHNLAAEVRVRLTQLDLILHKLDEAIAATQPDQADIQRTNEFVRANMGAVDRGEMSVEEFAAGACSAPRSDYRAYFEAWDLVTLYSEAFYAFAWRLVEVLRARGDYAFPKLRKIRATGIGTVRNQLFQHPEKTSLNFLQALVVTSDGPVLRSSGMAFSLGTGVTRAIDDSLDKGLFVNARELRDELTTKFDEAIVALTKPQPATGHELQAGSPEPTA